jgi:serine/threonine protein kinase
MPTTAYAEARPSDRGEAPSGGAFFPGLVLNGTYRVLERLASGGMGEVYEAVHERLPVRVAVKVLHRDIMQRRDAVERFGREALIMAGLRHPHVTQVFEFNVTSDGTPYLVMELMEGELLQRFIDRQEPVAPGRVATMVRQMGSALDAAHALGIVHRDLKPENVMLLSLKAHEAFVKVFDFGISKVRGSSRLTGEQSFMGTPEYMAPEQAQPKTEAVDHRTDQFSLAATCYALLSGRQPFTGDHPLGVVYQVINSDPPPLADAVKWPTAEVEKVLRRGLAKRPDERFPDVWSFACALADALNAVEHAQPQARAEVATAPSDSCGMQRRPRRRRLLTAALTATVAASSACATFVVACGGARPAHAEAVRMWRSIPSFLAVRQRLPALAAPVQAALRPPPPVADAPITTAVDLAGDAATALAPQAGE